MSDHWSAPPASRSSFTQIIDNEFAATLETIARTHECEWCGTHGFGTLGPCSPPTEEITGLASAMRWTR